MMKTVCRINPRYALWSDFIRQLPVSFAEEGRVLQDGRNLIKVLRAPDGSEINVKRYHRPAGLNLWVYSLGIRLPKGLRAYLYPLVLAERGIDTPEPIAYVEERHFGLLGYSYFVSVQCPYEHRCYEWGNAPAGTYEEMAKAFAAFTAKLHGRGILHRDYSPGNILWRKENDEYQFALVDINQMRFGKVGMRAGCKNFARLWGPKRFIILMVREYARLRGFDPDQCEWLALRYRRNFWKAYRRKKRDKIKFNLEL